jgi:hypothetical protein
MEGADKPVVADAPSGDRSQVGAQVRADGFGDADLPVLATPDNDVLAHPCLLEKIGPLGGLTGCDEVPTFGKRRRQRSVLGLSASGYHHSSLRVQVNSTC